MKKHKVSILGHEIFIKTNVEETRIKEAENLILDRYKKMCYYAKKITNEELLILVALSIADDFIQTNKKLNEAKKRLEDLLYKFNNLEV